MRLHRIRNDQLYHYYPGDPLEVFLLHSDGRSERVIIRLVSGQRGLVDCAGQKGAQTGPNPVDRGKAGSKYHPAVDQNGIPLAVRLSAANTHDTTQLLPLVDAIPPIIGPRGKPGRPRKRPAKLHADKAYDSSDLRHALRARGITPRIARRGIGSSERLGRYRWVVERTQAWLLGYRRLGVRYERRANLLRGFLHLACTLTCLTFLTPATTKGACGREARGRYHPACAQFVGLGCDDHCAVPPVSIPAAAAHAADWAGA